MGQDREFSSEEIDFALKTVDHFRVCWEQSEAAALEKDIRWKLRTA